MTLRPRFAIACAALIAGAGAAAQTAKLKIGLMLPSTDTDAALGTSIANGFRLRLAEQGGRFGGREVEIEEVDDASDPPKAAAALNRLIEREHVDVLVGGVHSGVAMMMARAAKERNVLLIVPHAGADAITGALCARTIFRSSFSNWQPAYAMGEVAALRKHQRAVTVTWKYAAGDESAAGFTEAFEKGGGKVVESLTLSFPETAFEPLLTQIAAIKPDAVYASFAGTGAVKFVKDYAAAGLHKSIPLYGPGFLTGGTLDAQGEAARGMTTTLHYADDLNTPRDNAFRSAYAKAYGMPPDVYAVQGYDAAQMIAIGMAAVNGDARRKADFAAALEQARIDSPRGTFTLSHAHNPVQDFYIRRVEDGLNKKTGVAVKALADPGRGCRM